ncbi:unnamed protein product, partial [Musa textilis]
SVACCRCHRRSPLRRLLPSLAAVSVARRSVALGNVRDVNGRRRSRGDVARKVKKKFLLKNEPRGRRPSLGDVARAFGDVAQTSVTSPEA